jgi:hypothetical protein
LALAVALGIGRALVEPRVLAAVVSRALLWLVLTLLLVALWGNSVSLLTLMIAPSHAFAALRLATLARTWRSEQIFRK